MPTVPTLSREALAAAPWAAGLAASYPLGPSEISSGPLSSSVSSELESRSGQRQRQHQQQHQQNPQELEDAVDRETAALLAARAASAASASASAAAAAIPTFFRSTSHASHLAVELRSAAHRVALQHKERGLLEDDELEALWKCITNVIQRRPPEPSISLRGGSGGGGGGLLAGLPPIAVADTAATAAADAESRVSYDELRDVRDEFAARLDSRGAGGAGEGVAGGGGDGAYRVAHYFSAGTFNRFERDAGGRVNGRTFMEFVVRHVALTQSRINLGCHDADADGWLREEELEAFVGRSVTTMGALQSLTDGFIDQYCRIATRR